MSVKLIDNDCRSSPLQNSLQIGLLLVRQPSVLDVVPVVMGFSGIFEIGYSSDNESVIRVISSNMISVSKCICKQAMD